MGTPAGQTTLYEKRGDVIFSGGRVSFFGRELSLPYFSASWPLAKLQCYPSSITVNAGPLLISISRADIEEVRFRKRAFWSVLIGDTLTIRHRANGPNPLVFFSYADLGPIVGVFKSMDVKVVEK